MDKMQSKQGMQIVDCNSDKSQKQQQQQEHDSGTALQMFLDRIPVSSIPSITTTCPVVELTTGDSLEHAIQLLYQENLCGALIADSLQDHDQDSAGFGRFSEHYMGYIDFGSLILWSLEQCEKPVVQPNRKDSTASFFAMLQQNPQIGQAKVGDLAKSFLWNPFFPVHLEDTLFHVLLLLSKHPRLEIVPVVDDKPDSKVIGFITQNAVTQLLLRSSGLEWFDGIADKTLSEFRFESQDCYFRVYGDQSLAEALGVLRERRTGAVAVVDQGDETIIGSLTANNAHLLLKDNELFSKRMNLTTKEFIQIKAEKENSSANPRMSSPVTAKRSDTLKLVMNKLVESRGNFCFVVDDTKKLAGIVTLRDIIIQFAPPCIDSGIRGGGFFDSALEQTGCQVKNGTIISDH